MLDKRPPSRRRCRRRMTSWIRLKIWHFGGHPRIHRVIADVRSAWAAGDLGCMLSSRLRCVQHRVSEGIWSQPEHLHSYRHIYASRTSLQRLFDATSTTNILTHSSVSFSHACTVFRWTVVSSVMCCSSRTQMGKYTKILFEPPEHGQLINPENLTYPSPRPP